MVNHPAIAAYQHVDAPKAKSHSGTGDLMHSHLQRHVKHLGFELLIPTRPALLTDLACPIHAHAVAIYEMADELLALRRPQSFFFRTSCNITFAFSTLSMVIDRDHPRISASRCSTCVTRSPGNEVSLEVREVHRSGVEYC